MNLPLLQRYRLSANTLPITLHPARFGSNEALDTPQDKALINTPTVELPKALRPPSLPVELWHAFKRTVWTPSQEMSPAIHNDINISWEAPASVEELLKHRYFGPKIAITGEHLLVALQELMHQKIWTMANRSYQDKLSWADQTWNQEQLTNMLQERLAVLDREGKISKRFVEDAIDTRLLTPEKEWLFTVYKFSEKAKAITQDFKKQDFSKTKSTSPEASKTPMLDGIQRLSAELVLELPYFQFNGQKITGKTLWHALWRFLSTEPYKSPALAIAEATQEQDKTYYDPALYAYLGDAATALKHAIPTGPLFQQEAGALRQALLHDFQTAGLINLHTPYEKWAVSSLPEAGYRQIVEHQHEAENLHQEAMKQIQQYLIQKCLDHVYLEPTTDQGKRMRITGSMLLGICTGQIQELKRLGEQEVQCIQQALQDFEQLGLIERCQTSSLKRFWNSIYEEGFPLPPLPTFTPNAIQLTKEGKESLKKMDR